jgi:TonB family protein
MPAGSTAKRLSRLRKTKGWVWAVGGSAWVHAALLATLVVANGRDVGQGPEAVVVDLLPAPPAADPQAGGPAAAELPARAVPRADEAPPAPPPPLDGVQADRDQPAPRTVAPREADGHDRAPPAPDQGLAGGRPPEPAFRHARSTLRSRLADGAVESQPSRLRTGRRAASPQAVRREARTGIGDSVASVEPSRLPSAARPGAPPAPAGEAADPAGGAGIGERVDRHLDVPRVSERPSLERGVGPLDAEQGERSFDTEARGRAADADTARAASDEQHPEITDFSRPTAPAAEASPEGRGPGRSPGPSPQPAEGSAPTERGARAPAAVGPSLAERERQREYDRFRQEIQRRVQSVLVFPKVLALRLEQGEAVVDFAVRPDGAVVGGTRIVKSSGFREFDAEAVRAVLRAAPYPCRPDGYRGSITVTFENPLIR